MSESERSEISSSTIERLLAAAGVAAISAGALIVGWFEPTTAGFFPACPLHTMTGLNCPGCGLTRGFHALVHGEVLSALHFNALLPFFAFVFFYLSVSMFLTAVRGRGLSWKVFSAPSLMYGFLIVGAVFFVLRNLPFYPFNYLAI